MQPFRAVRRMALRRVRPHVRVGFCHFPNCRHVINRCDPVRTDLGQRLPERVGEEYPQGLFWGNNEI